MPQASDFTMDSPLSSAISLRDADIINMVRASLKSQNVLLAYQPVVRSGNANKVAFYEALLRIEDPSGVIIPAKDFISQIELRQEGRMLDTLSLEHGLASLAANPGLRLSVNMSARSIGYPSWERALHDAREKDPTILERLILEVTESSAMEMPDLVVDFMARWHREGVSFGLDDFGAGYTAFRYFKDFQFDMVKIDKGFIKDVHNDSDNQVLTEALTLIARQFDMFTVAEGVEKIKEAEYLIDAGVDCLQGFLFGVPKVFQGQQYFEDSASQQIA